MTIHLQSHHHWWELQGGFHVYKEHNLAVKCKIEDIGKLISQIIHDDYIHQSK